MYTGSRPARYRLSDPAGRRTPTRRPRRVRPIQVGGHDMPRDMLSPRFTPCSFCTQPVSVLFTTCPHCGRRARTLAPAIESGSHDGRKRIIWAQCPELAPPEYWYPPINPHTGEKSPVYIPPDPPGTEAPPDPRDSTPKRAPRKRDEGKADRCVGIYMAAIDRGETPPTPTEIARQVGCSVSTVSRATKRWEARRTAEAREDAKGRYRRAD
jgi:hypothetical protein